MQIEKQLLAAKKKNSNAWKWVLAACGLTIVVSVCVAVFYNPKPPELPEKFKQDVMSIVGENKRFTVDKIEMLNTGTIQIMLKLSSYPKTENFIPLNVKMFINEIEKKYNYDINISMMVYMPIAGTDKVNYFGRGSFYKDIGKIEYEPAE